MTFFDVIDFCRCLDIQHTNAFARRCTKIHLHDGAVTFRVRHEEGGDVLNIACDFNADDNLPVEIKSLHNVIDDKLRHSKQAVDNGVLDVPF